MERNRARRGPPPTRRVLTNQGEVATGPVPLSLPDGGTTRQFGVGYTDLCRRQDKSVAIRRDVGRGASAQCLGSPLDGDYSGAPSSGRAGSSRHVDPPLARLRINTGLPLAVAACGLLARDPGTDDRS
jgi:hypothetical protein